MKEGVRYNEQIDSGIEHILNTIKGEVSPAIIKPTKTALKLLVPRILEAHIKPGEFYTVNSLSATENVICGYQTFGYLDLEIYGTLRSKRNSPTGASMGRDVWHFISEEDQKTIKLLRNHRGDHFDALFGTVLIDGNLLEHGYWKQYKEEPEFQKMVEDMGYSFYVNSGWVEGIRFNARGPIVTPSKQQRLEYLWKVQLEMNKKAT